MNEKKYVDMQDKTALHKYRQQVAFNLSAIREKEGYKQKELAEMFGMKTARQISDIERGICPIDVCVIQNYCRLFDITPNMLMGFEQNDTIQGLIEQLTSGQKIMLKEMLKVIVSKNTEEKKKRQSKK